MTFTGQKAVDARSLLFSRMEECYKVARALGAKTLRCLTLKSLEGNLHCLTKTKQIVEKFFIKILSIDFSIVPIFFLSTPTTAIELKSLVNQFFLI